MEGMDVAQVVDLRTRWLSRKDKNAVEVIPVATLIELADLIVCQAACLKQLDEGLTHLERLLNADRELKSVLDRSLEDRPGADALDALFGDLALENDPPLKPALAHLPREPMASRGARARPRHVGRNS